MVGRSTRTGFGERAGPGRVGAGDRRDGRPGAAGPAGRRDADAGSHHARPGSSAGCPAGLAPLPHRRLGSWALAGDPGDRGLRSLAAARDGLAGCARQRRADAGDRRAADPGRPDRGRGGSCAGGLALGRPAGGRRVSNRRARAGGIGPARLAGMAGLADRHPAARSRGGRRRGAGGGRAHRGRHDGHRPASGSHLRRGSLRPVHAGPRPGRRRRGFHSTSGRAGNRRVLAARAPCCVPIPSRLASAFAQPGRGGWDDGEFRWAHFCFSWSAT